MRNITRESAQYCHVENQFEFYASCYQRVNPNVLARKTIEFFRLKYPELLFDTTDCVDNLVPDYYRALAIDSSSILTAGVASTLILFTTYLIL